jgi:hypothetical protein
MGSTGGGTATFGLKGEGVSGCVYRPRTKPTLLEFTDAVRPEARKPFPVPAEAKQSGAGPAPRLNAADPAEIDDGSAGPVDLEAGEVRWTFERANPLPPPMD